MERKGVYVGYPSGIFPMFLLVIGNRVNILPVNMLPDGMCVPGRHGVGIRLHLTGNGRRLKGAKGAVFRHWSGNPVGLAPKQ